MTTAAGAEPTTRRHRLPWEYERKRLVGRCIGAWRVLRGKSASIPKGLHETAIGWVRISDYYGGCTFSIKRPNEEDLQILRRYGRDLYWTSQSYDGSGASMCEAD